MAYAFTFQLTLPGQDLSALVEAIRDGASLLSLEIANAPEDPHGIDSAIFDVPGGFHLVLTGAFTEVDGQPNGLGDAMGLFLDGSNALVFELFPADPGSDFFGVTAGEVDFDNLFGARRLRILGSDGDDTAAGGAVQDTLSGGTGADRLDGAGGNDLVSGGGGDDLLFGDLGADRLDGGARHDTLRGGDGNDELFGRGGNDRLFGDGDNDLLNGGAGADVLRGGAGVNTLIGAGGKDRLIGGASGGEELFGGAGDDTLEGRAGGDDLVGGGGDDRLRGQDGDDRLSGGAGGNLLVGGAGADAHVLGESLDGVHRVLGFDPGSDLIRIEREFAPKGENVTKADAKFQKLAADSRTIITFFDETMILEGVLVARKDVTFSIEPPLLDPDEPLLF